MEEKVKCENCGDIVPKKWTFVHKEKVLCEDCYFDTQQQLQACDPLAVRSAKILREKAGHKGAEGLTDLQAKIYNYIKDNGKATANELLKEFKISIQHLKNQLAILRHCELVKGKKEQDDVYLVLFDS